MPTLMSEKDLDELGDAEVQHRLDRGDFHDSAELAVVTRWLNDAAKERTFLAACQRASTSSALDAGTQARRANWIAAVALAISAIGAYKELNTIFRLLLSAFTP